MKISKDKYYKDMAKALLKGILCRLKEATIKGVDII